MCRANAPAWRVGSSFNTNENPRGPSPRARGSRSRERAIRLSVYIPTAQSSACGRVWPSYHQCARTVCVGNAAEGRGRFLRTPSWPAEHDRPCCLPDSPTVSNPAIASVRHRLRNRSASIRPCRSELPIYRPAGLPVILSPPNAECPDSGWRLSRPRSRRLPVNHPTRRW